MKKLVITLVCLVLLSGAYYFVRQHGAVSLGFLEGKWVETKRGDLVRPITASGKIEPASIVQMKGKASGEVVETPFNDGAIVRKGDLIVRLDPVDEQTNVDRAQAEYDRAEIALKKAQLSLEERENVGVPAAAAKLSQAKARAELARLDHEKYKEVYARGAGTQREVADTKARLDEANAVVQGAQVDEVQARLGVQMARHEIEAAEKARDMARKVLDDAQQRLKETRVFSPIEGMILAKHVQIGEVVQSGKTSLTGGTVLMEIADVSNLYAVVNVDEADIGDVRELAPPSAVPGYIGTRPAASNPGPDSGSDEPEEPLATYPAEAFDQTEGVEITIESFPQEKFAGVIERIAPQSQLIQAIATFKVWIRVTSENRDKLVGLLNTQCEARFTVRSVRDAILVSYDAIQKDPNSDRYGVYLVTRNPTTGRPDYEFRACRFGIDNGIDVEVIEGLAEGEKVWIQLPQQTEKERKAEEQRKAKKRT